MRNTQSNLSKIALSSIILAPSFLHGCSTYLGDIEITPKAKQILKTKAEEIARDIDTSNDSRISETEMQDFFETYDMLKEIVDLNRNGRIDKYEMKLARFFQFVRSFIG